MPDKNYTEEEIHAMMAEHIRLGDEAIKNPVERPLDKTSLSYWFPLIQAAGIPVPKTHIIKMPKESQEIIWKAFDGALRSDVDPVEPFYDELAKAAAEVGTPFFLRTNQTSAKHSWERTCYVQDISKLRQHVFEIVEFSECADWMGLAWDTWVVREFLPIIPYGTCPRYGNMPVNKEFRFFVDGARYICHHPYWPLTALQDGGWSPDAPEDVAYADLCELDYHTFDNLKSMASGAGMACGGAWSVDFLETERGWFLTDMAEAHKSFHWKGCKEDRNG